MHFLPLMSCCKKKTTVISNGNNILSLDFRLCLSKINVGNEQGSASSFITVKHLLLAVWST